MLHSLIAYDCSMCYRTRSMRDRLNPPTGRTEETNHHIALDRVTLRLLRLPLREAFETSFGSIDSRLIFLLCVEGEGFRGWGEVVAAEEPLYSYETVGTASHVIRDYLAQSLMSRPVTGLNDLAERFSHFKGHNMAKAGLEAAYVHILAQMWDQSLSGLIEGNRE